MDAEKRRNALKVLLRIVINNLTHACFEVQKEHNIDDYEEFITLVKHYLIVKNFKEGGE